MGRPRPLRVSQVMTNEEHLENTVRDLGGDDESFDVYLPVSPALDGEGATHVARMRGSEAGFVEVLAGFVATGSDLSERLRSPVDEVGLDRVRSMLEGLGPAHVESIEQLQT
jgi:hypothetical protein